MKLREGFSRFRLLLVVVVGSHIESYASVSRLKMPAMSIKRGNLPHFET